MRCDRGYDVPSSPPSSLKKICRSAFFSCCFSGVAGAPEDAWPVRRSSSTWLRSKVKKLPVLRRRYRILMSRICRPRRLTGGFQYDPLSYALNFDEGDDGSEGSEAFRYRKFPSRTR